jgi:hypothetical protein
MLPWPHKKWGGAYVGERMGREGGHKKAPMTAPKSGLVCMGGGEGRPF